jgi:hypothetical protein
MAVNLATTKVADCAMAGGGLVRYSINRMYESAGSKYLLT